MVKIPLCGAITSRNSNCTERTVVQGPTLKNVAWVNAVASDGGGGGAKGFTSSNSDKRLPTSDNGSEGDDGRDEDDALSSLDDDAISAQSNAESRPVVCRLTRDRKAITPHGAPTANGAPPSADV